MISVQAIPKRDSKFPALSASLKVEYDSTYNRRIVATKDIKPGQLLAEEDPLVAVPVGMAISEIKEFPQDEVIKMQ